MIAPEIQSDNTNSQQTLNIVRKWLRNCLETHKRCNHTAEPAWRPTRLLELDSPFSDYVTLNCTGPEATIVQTESYATLSHCWGHGDPLKLTSSSFPRLVGGIPVTELPKTFQDAIVIVRSLGLKCVWIDSLCIFQDSKDDWTSESSSMGKVYSQAVLNIGATASFGSNEGCIRERNPRFIHKKGIETSWSDRLNGRFQIYLHSKSATLDDISSTSPLLRRGWVVQEHMYSEGAPKDMALLTHPLVKRDEPSILTSRISDASRAIKVYKFWASLVEFYSRCSLTFKTDKLIALSGIAKIIQNATGETYFAGLWESQFPQFLSGSIKLLGLLWTVVIRLVESLDLEGKLDIQVKTGVVRIMCHKTACAFDKYPFSEISGSIDLHFMPITHQPNGSFQGLLLVPTGNSRGQFRRVGLLYFKWDEWVEDSWDEAIRAENHDWLEYVEFDGVDKYTITII
ncbi:HET-domain-containing protein [Mollisia scopiformis]|uniref:HET-domain-containing protein n=1 Tax=Mollisia scopiformis TaxID=149040 RepID=A0A194X0J4_MOLSC|nr:HET-domain-containing protein [Mollisia scopiformis]KUJ13387.1 HET-domain-containing protein [Mollisia scopiformis]